MTKHLPDSPTDLTKRSWLYVARKTTREFSKDQCTDLAAALTYYAVLALFPALIALLSLVGLVGQGEKTVDTLLSMLRDLGAGSIVETLQPTLEQLSEADQAAGVAFVVGLAVALWSASGFVGAFGRAMNRMYGVPEGRPFWKLRPTQLLVTLVSITLAAVILLALVLTGSVAEVVGDQLGLGETAVLVWDIAKWPVMLVLVMALVGLLYYATPNVKQPKFRWLSVGATVAILIWVLASVAFGIYVSNFSTYNKTYGALAGVIAFLLWLWITNLALLFGAELDSELERGRELQAGMAAEESLLLPLRDDRIAQKAERKERADIERGRALRESSVAEQHEDTREKEEADAR